MGKKRPNFGNTRKGEIVFDPDARKAYLQGFSDRKRQRRAYGLAMQKVKDRKARLEQRAEVKQAVEEQVLEAEKQKNELLTEVLEETKTKNPLLRRIESAVAKQRRDEESRVVDNVQTFEDVQTQLQWGGEVTVTTSTHIPGDSDIEDECRVNNNKRKAIDEQQQFAGKVDKYLAQVKAHMPAKKKAKERVLKHKGKHGASNMKGMASSGDIKLVQKALERSMVKVHSKQKHPTKRR